MFSPLQFLYFLSELSIEGGGGGGVPLYLSFPLRSMCLIQKRSLDFKTSTPPHAVQVVVVIVVVVVNKVTVT